MRHYTDLRLTDTAKALQSLPTISMKDQPKELKATGTEGRKPTYRRSSIQQICQQSGGLDRHSLSLTGSNGEREEGQGVKADGSESLGKVRQSHSLSSTDLIENGHAATLPETGAVGAVG